MHVRSAVALTAAGCSAAVVAALGTAPLAGAAGTPPGNPARASVTKAASQGGYVIVTMRNQFSDLKVRKNGSQRLQATRGSQRGVVSDIQSHGGSDVRHLVSVNAVAARVPAAEIVRLRNDPAVAAIQSDAMVKMPRSSAIPSGKFDQRLCPKDPSKPLQEPEALALTHFRTQPAAAGDAAPIANGKGVKVGLTGINRLAGNPNFIRPNGQHVVIDSPTPNADDSDYEGGGDEWYGDASSISGQGTVTYDFSKELPYSSLPAGCTFTIDGIAPGASLVDTGDFGQGNSANEAPARESEAIAGLDHAAIDEGVSVVSESYGYGALPGVTKFGVVPNLAAAAQANDELVASGITVVESSGDSGVGGTVETPAYDSNVIDAGATTSFRLDAQAWGYKSWQSNQMAALSSGGTTPANNVVDLVAPGDGGEATCSPASATCPQTTLTEAFGGTSQSAPFIAGAAADVIQAYSESHAGQRPSPMLVKQILTGTAHDIGASSDDQGAGLLDVGAAVRAAKQLPGSSGAVGGKALLTTPGQINVRGNGGASSNHRVSLYNASSKATTVHAAVRRFTGRHQIGKTVTENVTAPPASQPLPAQGAKAANNVSMNVPGGLAHLGVDFITPNPKNNAVLDLLLFDPKGRLTGISYDYSTTATGPVSNNEHVGINHPMAGRWTAKFVWNNGRSHLQDPPPKPGKYRGPISVRFTGDHMVSQPVGSAVTIAPHHTGSVTVPVTLPARPGDAPESVQLTGSNGTLATVPITRRTLIPSAGGSFTTSLGSSVARDSGPLKSFQIRVPKGKKDLRVEFHTADTSANNIIDYFLVPPSGVETYYDRTPNLTPRGVGADKQRGGAALVVANPPAGIWTVQVLLDLTTSGKEFDQPVTGNLAYNTSKVTGYGVPHSASTKLAQGSKTTVRAAVTNTTGVGRAFTLLSTNGEVTGPRVYIPAGATVLVPATLTPKAKPGTTVRGAIGVVSLGSKLTPNLASYAYLYFDTLYYQTVANLPYAYTVTKASSST